MKTGKRAGNGWLRLQGRHRRIRQAGYAAPLFGLMALTVGTAPNALARLADWLPVLTSYHSQLTLQSSYASDETKDDKGTVRTIASKAFRESLALSTSGYVYHPDLLLLGISGSLSQDQSSSLGQESEIRESSQGGFGEYYLKGVLLRKKPYNLNFFSRQNKPFRTSVTGDATEMSQESEAEFDYVKQVYRLKLKYNRTLGDTGKQLNTTDNYDFFGTYSEPKLGWLDNFSTTSFARYQTNVNATKLSEGRRASTLAEGLTNRFLYKMLNFTTGLNAYSTTLNDQQMGASQGSSDSISLNEAIGAELPWNLTSTFGGAIDSQKSDNSSGASSQSSTSDGDQFTFSLTNNLFSSLTTQFSVSEGSTRTSRTDRTPDISGTVTELTPVQGTSEHNQISLGSRYAKKLPFDSKLTGTVKTRSVQSLRTGISSESKAFKSIQDNMELGNNIIPLPNTIDTDAVITVDVLRVNLKDNPNDVCKDAFSNPRFESPSCWYRLQDPNDYTVHQPTNINPFPTITIEVINDNAGFDYEKFANQEVTIGPTHGPFNFRVTYFLKTVDAKTQSNTIGAGISFFRILSANYQHSVTSQEGSSGGRPLAATVTHDSLSLNGTWRPFTAGVSRNWIRADALDTTTRFWISYNATKKFFDRLSTSIIMDAHLATEDDQSDLAGTSSNKEEAFSCVLNSEMPLPYISGTTLTASNSYSFTKGAISTLELSSDGTYIPSQSLGINEQAIFTNTFGLVKAFRVPWINFVVNSFVRYLWETTAGDYNSEKSALQYGLNAARGWRMGATGISLNIRYANKGNTFDSEVLTSEGVDLHREDENSNTSVVLRVVRQLF